MEPITLCGAVIVLFGLWVEYEAKVMAVVKAICNSRFYTETISQSVPQRPVYTRKIPVCLAKVSH